MTRQTFVLAATRIIGVVSGFWLIQVLDTIIRTYVRFSRLFPDHPFSHFPILESTLALVLAAGGIYIGLRSNQLATRFEAAPKVPFRLSILFGLAAAVYMTGFACRTAIQISSIESVASYRGIRNFGTSQRVRMGYGGQSTQMTRLVGPGIALATVAIFGLGLAPSRRRFSA